IKSFLKNHRQAPRKVRLVTNFIKGKLVNVAQNELKLLPQRAGMVVKKLLGSAVANAKHNSEVSEDKLYVKDIIVNEGSTLKRFRPRAMGRSSKINKRSSHITIILAEKNYD